jgi:hypothetical protein
MSHSTKEISDDWIEDPMQVCIPNSAIMIIIKAKSLFDMLREMPKP